jgi:hypothetical protein
MQGSVMTWPKEVNDYVIPPGFDFALAFVYVIYLLLPEPTKTGIRLPLFSYRRDKFTLAAIYHILSKFLLDSAQMDIKRNGLHYC